MVIQNTEQALKVKRIKNIILVRMNNHNKIRPVDKNNLSSKYKILFSTPQTKLRHK